MKRALIALFVFSSLINAADYRHSLPDGSYEGTGTWNDDEGNEGTYTSKTSIADNVVRLEYAYEDHNFVNILTFKFGEHGKFKIVHNDVEIGKGFCIRHHCQYVMEIGDATYGESLDFDDGKLEKVGFRKDEHSFYRWEEDLAKVEDDSSSITPGL